MIIIDNMLTNLQVHFVGFIINVLYYEGFIIGKILEEANFKDQRLPLFEVWTSEAIFVVHRKYVGLVLIIYVKTTIGLRNENVVVLQKKNWR